MTTPNDEPRPAPEPATGPPEPLRLSFADWREAELIGTRRRWVAAS